MNEVTSGQVTSGQVTSGQTKGDQMKKKEMPVEFVERSAKGICMIERGRFIFESQKEYDDFMQIAEEQEIRWNSGELATDFIPDIPYSEIAVMVGVAFGSDGKRLVMLYTERERKKRKYEKKKNNG